MSPSAQAIQIRDVETGKPLTFQATPEQLAGISPGDRVLIKYKKAGESLIAEEVKKLQ